MNKTFELKLEPIEGLYQYHMEEVLCNLTKPVESIIEELVSLDVDKAVYQYYYRLLRLDDHHSVSGNTIIFTFPDADETMAQALSLHWTEMILGLFSDMIPPYLENMGYRLITPLKTADELIKDSNIIFYKLKGTHIGLKKTDQEDSPVFLFEVPGPTNPKGVTDENLTKGQREKCIEAFELGECSCSICTKILKKGKKIKKDSAYEFRADPDPVYSGSFTAALKDPQKTKVLSVYSRFIRNIPENINQLVNLERAELHNNDISELPESIYQLKNLESIDLGTNDISKISPLIGNMESLKYLNFRNNPLYSLPEELGNLNLKRLELEKCRLKQLPESIKNCSQLRFLVLEDNPLEKFPHFLSELENLEELTLDNIQGITDDVMNFPFDKLTNLKMISLQNLDLPAIPEALFMCENLEDLYLDNNRISEIPDVVSNLTKLERIRFEGNNVRIVPDSIGECKNLLEVDMVSNPLEAVTERLLELDKLDYIRISEKSVHCLDNFFDELNERISIYIR